MGACVSTALPADPMEPTDPAKGPSKRLDEPSTENGVAPAAVHEQAAQVPKLEVPVKVFRDGMVRLCYLSDR